MGFFSRGSGAKKTVKVEAKFVPAGDHVPIVGESYRQDALRQLAAHTTDCTPFLDGLSDHALAQAEKERGGRWFRAALLREPGNEHDPNAIAVYAASGGQIGYLSREDALKY
jgi:hypothetical protein